MSRSSASSKWLISSIFWTGRTTGRSSSREIPLSIGGGIGQSRTIMLLLREAHLGEVSVTVWPQILKDMCDEHHIHVLE